MQSLYNENGTVSSYLRLSKANVDWIQAAWGPKAQVNGMQGLFSTHSSLTSEHVET